MLHRSGRVVNWRGELRHMENVQEGKPCSHPGSLCGHPDHGAGVGMSGMELEKLWLVW